MKALSEPLSYLAGTIVGDAWCTRLTLGMRVADMDFAATFAQAIADVFGAVNRPRFDGRYWLVRHGNESCRFDSIARHVPETIEQKRAWLRGLFDSEGNAQLAAVKRAPDCFHRRIAFFSTVRPTLKTAQRFLAELGIPTVIRATRSSASHKGTRVVFELRVMGTRPSYALFGELVGSSIGRKQRTLDAMPLSYRSVA